MPLFRPIKILPCDDDDNVSSGSSSGSIQSTTGSHSSCEIVTIRRPLAATKKQGITQFSDPIYFVGPCVSTNKTKCTFERDEDCPEFLVWLVCQRYGLLQPPKIRRSWPLILTTTVSKKISAPRPSAQMQRSVLEEIVCWWILFHAPTVLTMEISLLPTSIWPPRQVPLAPVTQTSVFRWEVILRMEIPRPFTVVIHQALP